MDAITSGVAVTPAPRPAAAPRTVQRVARQLEASFAAEMLRAARPPAREGMFSGGIGARTFDSFMDNALAEAMMARGGLGLTPSIIRAVQGAQARQGAARSTP